MGGAAHHAVGQAGLHQKRAEDGHVGHRVVGDVHAHALVPPQVAQQVGHLVAKVGVLGVDECGRGDVQAHGLRAVGDRLGGAEDGEVTHGSAQQLVCRPQDAVVITFWQDDPLAVLACRSGKPVLEHQRSGDGGVREFDALHEIRCVDRRLEQAERGGDPAVITEADLRRQGRDAMGSFVGVQM